MHLGISVPWHMAARGPNRIANLASISNRGIFHGESESQAKFVECVPDFTIDLAETFTIVSTHTPRHTLVRLAKVWSPRSRQNRR